MATDSRNNGTAHQDSKDDANNANGVIGLWKKCLRIHPQIHEGKHVQEIDAQSARSNNLDRRRKGCGRRARIPQERVERETQGEDQEVVIGLLDV